MRAKLGVGLLALGFVALFAGMAAAAVDLPTPVVYLKMDGNLTNSGSGGAAYNGTIERIGTTNDWGTPVYGTAKKGQGINLNPNLVPSTTTTPSEITADGVPFKDNGGRNIAIPYTPGGSGTIAMWYKVSLPMYQYQEWFNNNVDMDNPRSSDQWEGWINEYGGVGARVNGWDSNMVSNLPSGSEAGWHHLAFTWNQHDGNKVDTALYIDGNTTGSVLTNLDWSAPGSTFYIGGNHHNSVANGTFDEAQIYNATLTAKQVGTLFDSYYLPGDANRDGTTDATDLNTVLSFYNQTGMTWEKGDFNRDGLTDATDLNTVLSYYNQTYSGGLQMASSAVPEPSSIVMLATLSALVGAWVIRRRNG